MEPGITEVEVGRGEPGMTEVDVVGGETGILAFEVGGRETVVFSGDLQDAERVTAASVAPAAATVARLRNCRLENPVTRIVALSELITFFSFSIISPSTKS